MICPICQKPDVTVWHVLGHETSAAKASAARLNGKLGGRPRKEVVIEPVAPVSVVETGRKVVIETDGENLR